MILSASTLVASSRCFCSDLEVLSMVLVEEIVLSLQRILFTSVTQVLASVPYQSPNPTNSSTYSYTSVHTRTRLVRSSECYTSGPDSPIISEVYVTPEAEF